jgi:hypothetical protein
MGSLDVEADARSRPWWPEFQAVREREHFFHWQLEFPEVFADGGFDCVLGNPPWEKVKPDRKEFYGRADVLIRAYTGGELDARIRELNARVPTLEGGFEAYSERLKTLAQCLKRGGDYRYVDWEIDGRSTGGDPDLFKFFVERAQQVLKAGGRVGYLVPSAIYNNEGCTGLRHLLLDHMKIERFYGFENRKKIFNIHSSYKFVCLIAASAEPGAQHVFPACFMRLHLDELDGPSESSWTVSLRRDNIARLSPGTLALLEFRSARDQEIAVQMHGLRGRAKPRPTLDDQSNEGWKAELHRELHATDDRDLWTRTDGRLWTAKEVCGANWPEATNISFTEIRAAMERRGFWPLYDGKNIDQFRLDVVPVDRWVSLEAHEKKLKRAARPDARVILRDIARNTDERTCIAAVLPEKSCTCHTLVVLDTANIPADLAVAVVNSFAFDFLVRLRAAGTHISWSFMSRVAVPSSAECRGIPVIETTSGHESSEPTHESIWKLNDAVRRAYGLRVADLAHVLSTFSVFARKNPELHAYLSDLIEESK